MPLNAHEWLKQKEARHVNEAKEKNIGAFESQNRTLVGEISGQLAKLVNVDVTMTPLQAEHVVISIDRIAEARNGLFYRDQGLSFNALLTMINGFRG